MSQANPVASDRRQQIDVLRAMVGFGEELASMEDVVHLLRQAALDPEARFEASQGRAVAQSLDDLEHELSRSVPDRVYFSRKVRMLIEVLAGSYAEAPLLPFVEGDAHAASRRTGIGAGIAVRVEERVGAIGAGFEHRHQRADGAAVSHQDQLAAG